MKRWYASGATARRERMRLRERGAATFHVAGRTHLRLVVCVWTDITDSNPVRFGTSTIRTIDVTGRTTAHVDRLARDWIGHGVAPCADGIRGVGEPANICWKHEPLWRLDPPCETCRPSDSYLRAEARARRVVCR